MLLGAVESLGPPGAGSRVVIVSFVPLFLLALPSSLFFSVLYMGYGEFPPSLLQNTNREVGSKVCFPELLCRLSVTRESVYSHSLL